MISFSNLKELSIGLYIILCICMLIALGPYLGLQKISVLILIPGLFAISTLYYLWNKKIGNTLELLIFTLFYLYASISIFYSEETSLYLENLSSLTGALMASAIASVLSQNIELQKFFHLGYIGSILILFIIMVLNGNLNFSNFSSVIDYRDRFLLNANAYSYFSVFANFSLLYLYSERKSVLNLIFLISIPVLLLIIAFTTQSRSGLLLIILINVMYWLFINSSITQSKLKKLMKRFLYIIIGIFIFMSGFSVFQNSRIKDRFVLSSNQSDPREILVLEGWQTFQEAPFFGVGLGQVVRHTTVGQFTHNSYVESLAENGIFGFMLISILFLLPLYRSFIHLKSHPKDEIIRISFLFFVVFLIYNNAYPFYKFPFSMMYFFFIAGLQEYYIRWRY